MDNNNRRNTAAGDIFQEYNTKIYIIVVFMYNESGEGTSGFWKNLGFEVAYEKKNFMF